MPKNSDQSAKKTFSIRKKMAFTLIIFVFLFLLITLLGELVVRVTIGDEYKKGEIPAPYDTAQKDAHLGWKMTPNYSFDGVLVDHVGNEYEAKIRYDKNGFKIFGDTATERPKIFFIGDSFTASNQVSNDKSFFGLIQDSLQVEVFAYGHPGFGTLQEYMIIDQWIDVVRPGLVVWEVCSNDFIDNHAPLEMVCGYNVKERRPYMDLGGKIYYKKPVTLWDQSKEFIYFYAWLDEHWNGMKETAFGIEHKIGEYYIHNQKRDYKLFAESIEITDKIFGMVNQRLPKGTALFGFSADGFQPQLGVFVEIFEKNGIDFYEQPSKAIDAAKFKASETDSVTVLAQDGCHWNNDGHRIIANSLIPIIRSYLE